MKVSKLTLAYIQTWLMVFFLFTSLSWLSLYIVGAIEPTTLDKIVFIVTETITVLLIVILECILRETKNEVKM